MACLRQVLLYSKVSVFQQAGLHLARLGFLARLVFLGHSPFGLVDVNKYMEGSGMSEIGICLHLRKLIRMSDPGLD